MKVALPGVEEYEVVGLARAGGAALPPRNALITDRTFVDGTDPKVETHLHLFDVAASAGSKSYVVTLRAKPTDAPAVAGITGVAPDALVTNPVESVEVAFTKAVDPATFTRAAIRVDGAAANCLGVSVAKIGSDVYHGTYDGKVYRNGTLLNGVNDGRERAVLSAWDDALVIGAGRWDAARPLSLAGAANTNLYERTRPVAMDVNAGGQIRRVYKVYGKRALSDEWSESPLSHEDINDGEHHFFRVTVEMP